MINAFPCYFTGATVEINLLYITDSEWLIDLTEIRDKFKISIFNLFM